MNACLKNHDNKAITTKDGGGVASREKKKKKKSEKRFVCQLGYYIVMLEGRQAGSSLGSTRTAQGFKKFKPPPPCSSFLYCSKWRHKKGKWCYFQEYKKHFTPFFCQNILFPSLSDSLPHFFLLLPHVSYCSNTFILYCSITLIKKMDFLFDSLWTISVIICTRALLCMKYQLKNVTFVNWWKWGKEAH